MKRKPQIGETLYSLNIGNAARYNESKLTSMTVSSVGKKYFTLVDSHHRETQFYIDTWRQKTIYCEDHRLYESEQEWLDEEEERVICQKISNSFEYGRNVEKLSLADLRKINDVIVNRS